MSNFQTQLPDGVFAASVTPLTKEFSVDHVALAKHCKWLLQNGNNGVCLMGTTGEANSFSVEERIEALDKLIASGFPADKLLVGTGLCALPDTIKLTTHAVSKNVGGVLMLPPFYYKGLSEDGLARYFQEVIKVVNNDSLRIYLYHFPKMTGVPFTVSLVKRLVKEHPGIVVGMKDSSGEWENMKTICAEIPGFKLYAGTEKYLLDVLKAGGAGCISATTNATGKMAEAVYQSRDTSNAESLQRNLTTARQAFEGVSFISGVKHIFATGHNNPEWLNIRPPNSKATPQEAKDLEGRLNAIGFTLPQ